MLIGTEVKVYFLKDVPPHVVSSEAPDYTPLC